MSDIEWSIHKDSKSLDRASHAKATKFWYLTHTQLSKTISFEMHCNNFIKAVGGLWCRHGCIPMGGFIFSPRGQRAQPVGYLFQQAPVAPAGHSQGL